MDNNTWTKLIKLSDATTSRADTKELGNITHIVLFFDNLDSAELVSLEFINGSPPSYQKWSTRSTNVPLTLTSSVETITLDIDSNSRMWIAYEGDNPNGSVNVQWSDSPYSNWNGPYILETGNTGDDICAITAFDGNKIGVLWSNQNDEAFQFKYHIDGEDPTNWSAEETAVSNNNVADDHINLAVGSDGSIYAAIKTSYNSSTLGLLVRRPSGNWENLHTVTTGGGTRPLAILDELQNGGTIYVVYQNSTGGGEIVYKYSSISNINFSGSEIRLDDSDNESYQDVTSTKQNINGSVVILYTIDHTETWAGRLVGTSPLPVELSSFTANVISNKIILNWRTETEVDNYGFDIEYSFDGIKFNKLSFVNGYGNSNSPKLYTYTDENKYFTDKIIYRLKQIDNGGSFEYSKLVSVDLGTISDFVLYQNYPNPFNPETTIRYQVSEKSKVQIKVYNILGKEVAELVNEEQEQGRYEVSFNADNLPSGTYFYTITAGNFHQTRKMTVLK